MLAEVKKVKVMNPNEKEKPGKESVFIFLKSISHSFILLLFFSLISQFSLAMFEGTIALHSQRLFSFGPRQMSIVFIVCGSLMGLLQLGPVAWLIKKWGEKKLLPYGLVILGIGMSLIMVPRKIEFILLYVSVISVGLAILTPALASLITKDTGKNYGISLGVFSSVNSLGQVLGVLIGAILMIWFDHLPYFLISFLLFIAAFFSVYGFKPKNSKG
jgi:DHA1 family multidrug resistance protein-like MFS transporter